MNSTQDRIMVDLIADAAGLWNARLEQPCPKGFTSIPVDQTVRSGP